jgi:hypothetical protein
MPHTNSVKSIYRKILAWQNNRAQSVLKDLPAVAEVNGLGRWIRLTLIAPVVVASSPNALSHGVGPSVDLPISWDIPQIGAPQISGIVTLGDARHLILQGKECLVGSNFYFNVRDEFAFDIDEDVKLTLEFAPTDSGTNIEVVYEKNGASDTGRHTISTSKTAESGWQTESIVLQKARFAGTGEMGSDFSLFAASQSGSTSQSDQLAYPEFTLCGISLVRSDRTPHSIAYGNLLLQVLDETNQATPTRVGIYDQNARMPLPSEDAVPVRQMMAISRVIQFPGLREMPGLPNVGRDPWPTGNVNPSAFYIDGRYGARLPVGRYELVVGKGPEYRYARRNFIVQPNKSVSVTVHLKRWDNLNARRWYSGEDHIHYTRESSKDDRSLLIMAQAEGLNVANIMQMGNVANIYFSQYEWKAVTDPHKLTYVLVPGQEDPRTSHRGHTLQLNLRSAVHNPPRYLAYEQVFRSVHNQGGLTGYAHVLRNPDWHHVRRGLALDVPDGLVDFVEVMQDGTAGTGTWFDYLNLGYKLVPTAGSDYPFHGFQPGTVRNYVKVDDPFTPQKWFDALKEGRTFVTSGPMLNVKVNGREPGGDVHVKSGDLLLIRAQAAINPDLGLLDRIELIEQGEVVKTVAPKKGARQIRLHWDVPAKHGTWYVLRASGRSSKEHAASVALSAPIYVRVNGENFWKPTAVPEIVSRIKEDLVGVLRYDSMDGTEPDETSRINAEQWESQKSVLAERVRKANVTYDALAKSANEVMASSTTPRRRRSDVNLFDRASSSGAN